MHNPFRRRLGPELRSEAEVRSITSVPWYPFNVGPSKYERPSEQRAMGLSAVFAAVRFLCDGVSTLPLKPYRRVGPEQREPMSSLPQLFQFLVEDGTLVDWVSRAVQSLAVHGNAIGLVTSRDGFEFPTVVNWRPRSEFHVDDGATGSPAPPKWYWNGRPVERSELVHIPWITVPGKTLGLSPIEYYALTLSSGLQAQEFGNNWFTSGGVPPGTFKNASEKVEQAEAMVIKSRLSAAIKSGEPIVYGKDWDFNAIQIPPEQAQFVESQKLSATQIASIYGIAPEEIGGESPNALDYNTEELRQIRRIADLRPWLVRVETGFSALLPERQYVKFNANAVARSDLKTRMSSYKIAREIGVLSVDEIRELEDRPVLPNGEGADFAPLSAPAPAPKAITTGQDEDEQPLRVVS